LVENSANG
jgi:hypothetical protein